MGGYFQSPMGISPAPISPTMVFLVLLKLYNGSVTLNQDALQYPDLNATLTIQVDIWQLMAEMEVASGAMVHPAILP